MGRHAADSAYGVQTLFSGTITTAVTNTASDAGATLTGVTSAMIEAAFTHGSGGTSVTAWVQTRLPSGAWLDVACFEFTDATATKLATVSARTPVTTMYTATALTAGQVKDGIIGDAFRVRRTTVGTYAEDTTLIVSIRPMGH
jgi:hypothetical protein